MTTRRAAYRLNEGEGGVVLLNWITGRVRTGNWHPNLMIHDKIKDGITEIFYVRSLNVYYTTNLETRRREAWPSILSNEIADISIRDRCVRISTRTESVTIPKSVFLQGVRCVDTFEHVMSPRGEEEEEEDERAPILVAPVREEHKQTLPKHIVDSLLRYAEHIGTICPITMEPIRTETGAVTDCGHIFNRSALAEWQKTQTTCPECRQTMR
jgi:hypothetical protein